MSSLFLSNEIIVFLFTQIILYVLLFISFLFSIKILKNWDFQKTTALQYKLEKESYLVILIISFALFIKIPLFFYFIKAMDNFSSLIPGAMCAAGIVSSNDFGEANLFLKILILFFVSLWLILNSLDIQAKNYPYTKKKYFLYIFIFLLFTLELVFDFLFLKNIPTIEPVSCCSIIFGINGLNNDLPFSLSTSMLLIVFYLVYLLTLFLNIQKKNFLTLLANSLFLYISYFAVTYFFSTYIYELPTHQCPFCMLQKEYNYVGYFIWSSLFLGVFFGSFAFILNLFTNKNMDFAYKYSIIFNTVFVISVSFYVLRYYVLNGVFL